jgi:signal transduction histidine kinase
MSETKSSTPETNGFNSSRSRPDARFISLSFFAIFVLTVFGWLQMGVWKNTNSLSKQDQPQFGYAFRESLTRIEGLIFRFQLAGNDADDDALNNALGEFSRLVSDSKKPSDTGLSNLASHVEVAFQKFSDEARKLQPAKGIRRDTPANLSEQIDHLASPVRVSIANFLESEKKSLAARELEASATFEKLKSSVIASGIALALFVALSVAVMSRGEFQLKAKSSGTAEARERHEKLASLAILAGGVAHEIRNPLTAIKMRLFSLNKAFGNGLAQNENFQTVKSEIDRLENIVKGFLEFARPPDPQFGPVSTKELLCDLERLLEPEISSRGMRLIVDPGEPISFNADKQQLSQVLINLAQNAADSMAPGGTVTISARQGAAVLSKKSEPVVLLDVIDTGSGVAPDIQERLFDPFFSTKEGGTGLGLAIASRIVDRHGGIIQFSSRKGEGATFTIVVPMAYHNRENADIAHRG